MSASPSSFPPPDQPILAEVIDEPEQPEGRRWFVVAIMVVAFVISIGMLGVWILPTEAQKWRLASAEEKRLSGDLEGAIAQLDQDLARDPRNLELRRKRAAWLWEKKDYQAALDEVNRILKWQPTDVAAYQLRAQIHQSMGEFAKAVDDWKTLMSFDAVAAGPARAECLNGLAYARGLANIELEEGLANVNEAMRITVENYAMLDTRGYLYYRQADYERALKDLDLAVEAAEADYRESLAGGFALPDRREKQLFEKYRAQTVAVIRYHRGLVYKASGDSAKAEADFQRVRELGFEPDDSLF